MPVKAQTVRKRLGVLPSLVLSLSLAIFMPLVVVEQVQAADPKPTIRDIGYSARYVSQTIPDPITIEAGAQKEISVSFKNTGTVTWNSSPSRYISAYTMKPRYRNSVFASSDWISSRQPAKMSGTVAPGQIGTLTFTLDAPEQTGEYVEHFYLAAENYSWMRGGYFYLKIHVVPATEKTTDASNKAVKGEKISAESNTYKGKRIFIAPKSVSLRGGEKASVLIGLQNIGESGWSNYQIGLSGSSLANVSAVSFADDSWQNSLIAMAGSERVEPFAFLRKTITIQAPREKGQYTASFDVSVDGHDLGVPLDVAVEVTSDAPSHYKEPSFDGEVPVIQEAPWFDEEPRIRVGLWKNPHNNTAQFVSYEDDYDVYNGTELVGTLPRKNIGILKYTAGVYSFDGGDLDFRTNNHIRLAPRNNPSAVFTLMNYDRHVSWKGPGSFNKYRGAVEIRRTDDSHQNLYIINDLLMEDYVKGIGETSNRAPVEMQKAQAVAARTYAYYIKEHSGKHDERHFDVVATTGDQLYLGYHAEGMTPVYVNAAKATRGYMVTYDNQIVITPYFGNSDGKTRSWTQVWGGSHKAWLVPVIAEFDQGRRLFGHGVGMSQRDAAYRAEEKGASWRELIEHYYTGVDIEKIYE